MANTTDREWFTYCTRMAEAWERMGQHHDWLALAAKADTIGAPTAEKREQNAAYQERQAEEARDLATKYRRMATGDDADEQEAA